MSRATPAADRGVALAAHELVKRYRVNSPPAVDGVTLTVPVNSITALVGPNGAGKSTLIRLWLGFERPTRGRTSVMGIDPVADSAGALTKIGYVPQGGSLYRDLSADDHLRLAASFRSEFDRAIAMDRLERARVPLQKPVRHLSGGQQAQVCLAIALATRAPILILDEPLASLDPLARRSFMKALHESVRGDGGTVLLSSHVVADVEGVADRLIVLVDGRVALDLDAAEAVATHSSRPGRLANAVGLIPGIVGPDRALVLEPPRSAEERAPLEDIVMAYLAGRRSVEGPG